MKHKLSQFFIKLSVVMIAFQAFTGYALMTATKAEAAAPTVVSYTITTAINPTTDPISYISPNNDGIQDGATFNLTFSEEADYSIAVTDPTTLVVFSQSGHALTTGPITWDGKKTDGTAIVDGTYAVNVVVKNALSEVTTDVSRSIVVDTAAPTGTIAYSTTALTNNDVTATVTPSEPVQMPVELSHVFTENGSWDFHFYDLAGNPAIILASVANIDKVAPTASLDAATTATNVSLNFTEPLYSQESGLALTGEISAANFDALGVVINSYNYDSAAQKMTLGLSTPAVGATFRLQDVVGKGLTDQTGNLYLPQLARFNGTSWILSDGTDNIAPTATITYSAISPTNQNVTATLVPSEALLANTELTHTFTDNGKFTFVICDLAGNVSFIEAEVANIDRTAPVAAKINNLETATDGTTLNVKYEYPADALTVVIQVSTNEQFNDNPLSFTQTPPTGSLSISGLTAATKYFIRTNVYDVAGNMTTSAIQSVTTATVATSTPAETETAVDTASDSYDILSNNSSESTDKATTDETKQTVTPTEENKGQIKGGEDEKETKKESKSRDILIIIALLAIAGAAYYGYKKLPESDEISMPAKEKKEKVEEKVEELPIPEIKADKVKKTETATNQSKKKKGKK